MRQQYKRTLVPASLEVPPPATLPVTPVATQPLTPPPPQFVLPPSFFSTYIPDGWFPAVTPQSIVTSSSPCLLAGLRQPGIFL
uniref:Uncharacterized protein n=1 Tax=Oryza nivara TaxID=4536 RepID=A0A0E0FRR4_ORYNI